MNPADYANREAEGILMVPKLEKPCSNSTIRLNGPDRMRETDHRSEPHQGIHGNFGIDP